MFLSGGRNPPIDLTEEDLVPNFKMVQHRDVSVVVLMDTSGSMGVSLARSIELNKKCTWKPIPIPCPLGKDILDAFD